MNLVDIEVGQTYLHEGGRRITVTGKGKDLVLGVPDYPTCKHEGSYRAEYLRPLPRRFVVELRLPFAGERHFNANGDICVSGGVGRAVRLVIVEELS